MLVDRRSERRSRLTDHQEGLALGRAAAARSHSSRVTIVGRPITAGPVSRAALAIPAAVTASTRRRIRRIDRITHQAATPAAASVTTAATPAKVTACSMRTG